MTDEVLTPEVISGLTPPELAKLANEQHALACEAFGSTVEHAWEAGQYLLQAKTAMKHGEWTGWLGANFDASLHTARAYMKVAKRERALVLEEGSIRKALPPAPKKPKPASEPEPVFALGEKEAILDVLHEEYGEDIPPEALEQAVAENLESKHPAPFSRPILDAIAGQLCEMAQGAEFVLDPFAGTGRIHELQDESYGGWPTVGIEIEPEWATNHPDTLEGNALELTNRFELGSVGAIATSPTYGNRMADHHDAKDDSVRLTYKHTLGRDLHDDNSGQLQWGDEYRRFHEIAWAEAVAVLKPGGTLTLNIKNHFRGREQQRVAEWHLDTLYGLGMHLVALDFVPGKGLMAGENHESRVLAEYVMTFRKPA